MKDVNLPWLQFAADLCLEYRDVDNYAGQHCQSFTTRNTLDVDNGQNLCQFQTINNTRYRQLNQPALSALDNLQYQIFCSSSFSDNHSGQYIVIPRRITKNTRCRQLFRQNCRQRGIPDVFISIIETPNDSLVKSKYIIILLG